MKDGFSINTRNTHLKKYVEQGIKALASMKDTFCSINTNTHVKKKVEQGTSVYLDNCLHNPWKFTGQK